MVDRILGLHGWAVLAVVFLAPALEASAFLGVIVPGEIAVLLGGVLAFEHRAPLPAVLGAAVAGAIIGDSVGYLVGRRWGRGLLDGSVGRLVPGHHLDRAERYLAQRGGPAVFFGRFTAALRALIPGLAGMAGLHYRTFAIYNAGGGLLWASGFVLLGYVAGTGWRQVEQLAKRASLLLLLALLATAALVVTVRWLIGHRDRITALADRQLQRPWLARLRDRYQGQLAFLARRLQPGGALGLSLTLTVAALVAAGWAFGAVLQDVLARDELELVDQPVARFFVGHREAWLTRLIQDLTNLGSVRILVPLLLLVGVGWWLRRRTWRPLGLLAAASVGADLAFNAVKELVHRPRPPVGILLKPVAGPSFPSGHATQAVAVYGMLAALAAATTTSWARKVAAWTLAVVITGAVAVSRLYLGAHWLTDVLGGLALGAAWLFALLTSVRTIDQLRGRPPTSNPQRRPSPTIRRRRPTRPKPEGHQPTAAPMAELVRVDRALVQALNHAAQPQPLRLLVLLVATVLAAAPALLLAVLAVQALRRRDPASLAVVALTAVGGAAALGLNQLAGHLYFRPRPYWALPAVHAIGGRAGDSSFFSDHTTIAAAAATGCLLLSRRWGFAAVGATVLVALGRVAIGAHYPSDVAVALAVGAGAVAALLPLRSPTQLLIRRLLRVDQPAAAPHRHELRLGVAALVLLALLGGWMVARVQDHGLRVALNRADGRLGGHLPTGARLYRPTSIDTLAAGRWRPTRARLYGQVTYVNRELDGDIHIVLKAPDGAFVVLEIIPELPIPAPHDDDRITAWGIVRHDGLHNWWELHPLIGWTKGQLTAPATGGLDD